MNHHTTNIFIDENPFMVMLFMYVVNAAVFAFSLTEVVSGLVPYFQLAALSMTIYVGYRTVRKHQNKETHGKERK